MRCRSASGGRAKSREQGRRGKVKKIGILNQAISEVIAGMGHMDLLAVADAGLPIPPGVRRIDLAVRAGLPGFLETVEAVAAELQVQRIVVAEETAAVSPHVEAALRGIFPGVAVDRIPHAAFKELCRSAVAVVRTGEFTPYANVILESGVVF
jgi:D-ribose pyranase